MQGISLDLWGLDVNGCSLDADPGYHPNQNALYNSLQHADRIVSLNIGLSYVRSCVPVSNFHTSLSFHGVLRERLQLHLAWWLLTALISEPCHFDDEYIQDRI